jgi:hypothetical protein
MPKLFSLPQVNDISVEKTIYTPQKSESLHIPRKETGIQFFGGKCTVRLANKLELRQKASNLIYNVYLKSGLAKKTDSELWLSIFDALPETMTLVAEDESGRIGGALTLVFDSPIGLPADQLYKNEVDKLRNAKRKICEIISFGMNIEANGSIKVLACLFYCSYLLSSRIKNATDFIITVNPCYNNLYCRKLLFKKIGPEKNYAKVNGAPSVLLNLSLKIPGILKHKQRIFPLYLLKYSEQEELDMAERIQNMHRPMSDEEFYVLFIEKTDIWAKASPQQKEFIKKVYPPNKSNHYRISRALARAFSKKNQSSDVTRNGNNSVKIARQ